MKTAHRKFGDGEVLSIDENYIKVSFNGKISEFVYPDAIAKGILVVNDELYKKEKSDMAKKDKAKQEEEEKRRKEEEEKRKKRGAPWWHRGWGPGVVIAMTQVTTMVQV